MKYGSIPNKAPGVMHPLAAAQRGARQCTHWCYGSRRRSGVVCPLFPARLETLRRREIGETRKVEITERAKVDWQDA